MQNSAIKIESYQVDRLIDNTVTKNYVTNENFIIE